MAPQTRRRITPSGHGPYLWVLATPGRCARLGLGRPRTSRQLPINHLAHEGRAPHADLPASGRSGEEVERSERLLERRDHVDPRGALARLVDEPPCELEADRGRVRAGVL